MRKNINNNARRRNSIKLKHRRMLNRQKLFFAFLQPVA